MRRRRSHRLPLGAYADARFTLFTVCVRDRQKILTDRAVVDATLDILTEECGDTFAVPAYCFMPDHLHMLIESLEPNACLLSFMARFKQRSGFWLKRVRSDFQWQRSYHDHVLRAEEGWKHVARYVLENPIRAGIVGDPLDYPFSGCIGYAVDDILDDFMFD